VFRCLETRRVYGSQETDKVFSVEGLNCKRPIQCLASSKILTSPPPHRPASVQPTACKRPIQSLASSKILTPHPLTARRVCNPPPLVRGEDTLAGWRGGWGVNILADARHRSVLYTYVSTLWCSVFRLLGDTGTECGY
jgi:hypothetical protein